MWETAKEFKDWWMTERIIRPPYKDFLFLTDIATCFVMYRSGQYQVELVLGYPNKTAAPHAHPHMDIEFIYLAGDMYPFRQDVKEAEGSKPFQKENPETGAHMLFGYNFTANRNEVHGVETAQYGGATLNFEKWYDRTPTSVVIDYEGETLGEVHTQIMKDYKNA